MIYDWARVQAKKNPDKIAVTLNGCHLSYGKLESLSNRLAGMLLVAGVKPGDRVALMMGKNADTIIAMHGINKAGGVYVPINTGSSRIQIQKILKASRPSMIIVDKPSNPAYVALADKSDSIKKIPWIWWSKEDCIPRGQKKYSFTLNDVEQHPNYPYQKTKDEHSPAYIIFRSNVAAEPDGIVISHNNLRTFINWADSYFDIESSDRISAYSPFYSGLSAFDIYSTMAAGAHLYIVPSEQNELPDQISNFILENDITQWFSPPSALDYVTHFKSIPRGGYCGLKRVIWNGEMFQSEDLQYWMDQNPETTFTSLFGVPEATIASSFYTYKEIPESSSLQQIGSPCSGEDLLVLDEDLNPVEDGSIADLYISGNGLSVGYWNNSQKTKDSFFRYINCAGEKIRIFKTGLLASRNSKGQFYFHGKAELQVDCNGHRIRIDDIENALSKEKKLREYAIVPVQNPQLSDTAIACAYVTTGKENGEMPPILEKNLKKSIPGYMIPKYWKCFDKLPRNGNGKIDRKSLAEAFKS